MNGTTPPRRRGRPAGGVPIERDPRRYEVALFLLLKRRGLPNYIAGRTALLFVGTGKPIDAALVAGKLGEAPIMVELSAGPDLHYGRADWRVTSLIRRARRYSEDLVTPDCEWAIRSIAALEGAWAFWQARDHFAVSSALSQLADLGWTDVIRRAAERYAEATGGPALPHELAP